MRRMIFLFFSPISINIVITSSAGGEGGALPHFFFFFFFPCSINHERVGNQYAEGEAQKV